MATVLDLIGNTPLVTLRTFSPNPKVRILAKLEFLNPGGSIKDRPALAMIEAAESSGELTKDKVVLEPTSGNTGIGLAMVCAVKRYHLTLVMSEGVSIERQRILKAYGADFILTPADQGTDGAIEKAYTMAQEEPDRFYLPDQFNNPNNPLSHYHGTAPEIWNQTKGEVDAIVVAMGTTGTLMGIARRFRELKPSVKIIGVEPYLGHHLQGLKNLKEAYRPGIFDKTLIDDKINIHDEDAFELARRLTREEGIFVGMSSGASLKGAIETAMQMISGTVVTLFPDGGERYLSTDLFSS